jgi:hypothetical protein
LSGIRTHDPSVRASEDSATFIGVSFKSFVILFVSFPIYVKAAHFLKIIYAYNKCNLAIHYAYLSLWVTERSCQYPDYVESHGRMNDELERICKEAVVA